MSSASVPELLKEVQQRAFEQCMELAEELTDAMLGSDGETFGDDPMTRGDRILRWYDLSQSGAADILKVVSPKWYEKLYRQYARDIQESPLMRPHASSSAPLEPPVTNGY